MTVLPSLFPLHDLIAILHHCIVDGFAFVANALLLAAILLRSPRSMGPYKILLTRSALVELIAAVTALLCMTRPVPVGRLLAFIYIGPCSAISGELCHGLMNTMLCMASQSLLLLAAAFFYRYYVLLRDAPRTRSVYLVCLVVSVYNLPILISFPFTLDETSVVISELRKMRPLYQLDNYVIEGHATIFTAVRLFVVLTTVLPAVPALIAISILRRKVMGALAINSGKFSDRTLEMHKTLTRVLSIQSMLPLFLTFSVICYVPCQLNLWCSETHEHLILASASYVFLISPIVAFCYVRPYREFIPSLCRRSIDIHPYSIGQFTVAKCRGNSEL